MIKVKRGDIVEMCGVGADDDSSWTPAIARGDFDKYGHLMIIALRSNDGTWIDCEHAGWDHDRCRHALDADALWADYCAQQLTS